MDDAEARARDKSERKRQGIGADAEVRDPKTSGPGDEAQSQRPGGLDPKRASGAGGAARPPRVDRNPRQRLDVATRQAAILDAAMAAFADAPYAEVRMADVAARVDASPALLFRYYGSKAELYAAVLEQRLRTLAEQRRAAAAALPPNTAKRDRMGVSLHVHLDHVAAHPRSWASRLVGGEEPPEAVAVRARARSEELGELRDLLRPRGRLRHEFALAGFAGFVDHATLAWVEAGCPDDQRHALVDAALGALQGALGDWGG